MRREPTATIDFETRSAADLKKVGSWAYACHPSTEVLCLAFRLPTWEPERVALWHPAFPHLGILASSTKDLLELFEWIWLRRPVEAHNAWFERGIWQNVLVPEGWPEIEAWQWRCSAAKAAAHTLPRKLEEVAAVLRLEQQKDKAGHTLMKKLSKPRKPRKAERAAWDAVHPGEPHPTLWWESKEWFEQLWAYCAQDVRAEAAVSEAVPDLAANELELYLIDQDINERGFQLDEYGVAAALILVQHETPLLNKELAGLTGGMATKATQREKLKKWFATQGLTLENTQKDTIEELLLPSSRRRLSFAVQRGLELLKMLGKASTAKYQTMQGWMGEDGRVRGGLLFHGAGTGRWSGSGVQPHNFVRGIVKNMPALWDAIKTTDRAVVKRVAGELSYGKVKDVLDALSQALRGAIIAPPGRQLYVADYAAIEARVVNWLADNQEALDIFRRHEDIYKDMAKDIYQIDIREVTSAQRQLGKQAVLGLGFQMGAPKFQATCDKYGIIVELEFSQMVVAAYRNKYYQVVNLWHAQEGAAVEATYNGDGAEPVVAGKTAWVVEGEYLYCILPSGRRLAYPEPDVREWETSWGAMKTSLTFTGVDPYTRKWKRRSAYGGLLVENITQAIARDLMADAIRRADESHIYDIVLSVHDELIAEADLGAGSVEEFTALMSQTPAWAEGCPVEAEGWRDVRYRK
jgi:DNA polymerase